MRAYCVGLLLFFSAMNPASEIGAEGVDSPVLEMMTAYDQALFSDFTLTAEASYPTTAFDQSQGYCTATVDISGKGDRFAMRCTQTGMDTPRYSASRGKREYDDNGHYVVSFAKATYVYLGPDRSKTRIDQQRESLNEENQRMESKLSKPYFDIREAGNDDSMNRVFRFLLPLGRGFSGLMDEVIETSRGEKDGLLHVIARGSLFSPTKGIWEIELDTENDYLVRSATFTADGAKNKAVMFHDPKAGIVESELPIWKRGTFYLAHDYRITVESHSTSNRADENLLGRVESAVNTVAADSTLLDFTALSEDGKPLLLRGIETP